MSITREARPRILIVDDDASIHDAFRSMLVPPPHVASPGEVPAETRQAGRVLFEVHGAFRGHEALEIVRTAITEGRPFAAAFVDIQMPSGWDGIETVRQLWQADPHLEVVFCTASSSRDSQEAVARLGQSDRFLVLKKPFEGLEVQQLALVLSAKWRLRREAEERHAAAVQSLSASNDIRGRQGHALELILDVSQSLVRAESVNAILRRVIRATAELTGCRRISIMLPDPTGEHLLIAEGLGISEELVKTVRVPVGGAIAGRVFATGSPIVINSPDDHARNHPQYDSGFFVSAPLMSRALMASEQVIGVLNITERSDGQPFTPDELANIETVCNMAASAIHDIQAWQARDAARDALVRALATLVEYRDGTTGKHLDRVTDYSMLLAQTLREKPAFRDVIKDEFLQDLRRAAPLHDIGKVGVPDAILCKRGGLTAGERAVIRQHAEIGGRVIRDTMQRTPDADFLSLGADIAECHHERFDGTGYPHGWAGEAIPLCARIVALADVYDALTTRRPYKEAFPHKDAVEMIRRDSGKHFDPEVVAAFLQQSDAFEQTCLRLADENHAEADSLVELMAP